MGKFSIGELLEKIGIAADLVSVGGWPTWLSPSRPLGQQDLERLCEGAAEIYGVFLERVSAVRNLTTVEVDAIGGGRVFTGGSKEGVLPVRDYVDTAAGWSQGREASAIGAGAARGLLGG